MITCVLKSGGEYGARHVTWLQRQVGQLRCISDIEIEGVEVIRSNHDWPKWWAKMEMFSPDISGDIFFSDLDTVFLKGVPDWNLTETTVLSDMYGFPHMNSGLMFIKECDKAQIWDFWIRSPEMHMKRFYGDQDFLDVFWRKKPRFQGKFYGEVVSYKADILTRGFTGKEKVVCFHGQPRPWAAANREGWIPEL